MSASPLASSRAEALLKAHRESPDQKLYGLTEDRHRARVSETPGPSHRQGPDGRARPAEETLQLNDRGDRLRLTPELVISARTGIRRRLERVRRALARDVTSLHALYEYARLHGYVRVRFGFLDERVPFDWPLPRESDFLYSILKTAEREERLVEIVLGRAPDWRSQWSSARRGHVSELRWKSFRFLEGPRSWVCDCADVHAVRWVASER